MTSSALFSPAPAMQSVFHSLNIGTLAAWLSVAGFGTVGVVVPHWHPSPALPAVAETTVFDQDFMLGDPGPTTSGAAVAESATVEQAESLPAPPELQPIAELAPLPEIPAMPVRAAATHEAPAIRESTARRTTRSGAVGQTRSTTVSSARSGSGGSSGVSTASGMSSADRLAAGRMPAPVYPAECRRKGQTGTVVVEFTVDSSGRVISAHAKSPSPWPLLNNEAVRTVRCWKFPPGGIMKLQRPIVFQLR
ncbi:MAG: energy transducer TonB [Verrucomicrobiaceae bacterium]|jgi:TonB family protein|nr:MAG: energy transducer TonB [Verrucomicrobiaceae bacterium]